MQQPLSAYDLDHRLCVDANVTMVKVRQPIPHGSLTALSDLHLLRSLAGQAAVAVENARLFAAVQRELTERQQAEETLPKSQQFLQSTLNALSANIAILCATIHDRGSWPCPSHWHHHSGQVPEAAPDQV